MDLIKEQLSFYFSFANLANDKVLLMKLLYEKGVSPEFLLKFNKLNELLKEFEDPLRILLDACMEIPELEVKENKITVKAEISQDIIEEYRENAVGRSLYFENIPDWTDISLLKVVFEKYGKVLYVSLPKWSETGLLKGFGFVEFNQRLACEAAIENLNEKVLNEFRPYSIPFKIMGKQSWLQFKDRLQVLKTKLRSDSPDREYFVLVTDLPEQITKTQINDMLEIKPWKIEYKQASQKAKLIYTNSLDTSAIIRCQPSLLGRQVYYSLINSKKN